ncbi:hypothetical protein PPUN109347_40790 [Pseudomonas putida]|nr:hypothetical protein PPUN109347_40790 [Pseudomonas putida]
MLRTDVQFYPRRLKAVPYQKRREMIGQRYVKRPNAKHAMHGIG